jgi:hypothetical protein
MGLMSGNENTINGVNIGYLYAYIRNPHHIGILKSPEYFFHYHAGKVLMAIIAFILALTLYRKQIPSRFKWINTFLVIILAQNLLFLVVALFDKNGFVAKFYPWRGSSLAMFFFQMATLVMLRYIWMPKIYTFLKRKYQKLSRSAFYVSQMAFALSITIISLTFTVNGRIAKAAIIEPGWVEVDALSSNLKSVSEKGDMFMLLGEETLYNISIPRKSERDVYYFFRCIPSQTQSIYEWYVRGLEQDKVKEETGYLVKSGLDKKINFIVSDKDLNEPFLTEVYRSDFYRIYKVNHD